MHVHKFGGASIATPERMRALVPLLKSLPGPAVLVVSALGKTTNALEALAHAACSGAADAAARLRKSLEEAHLAYARTLLPNTAAEAIEAALTPHFAELQWAVEDAGPDRQAFHYDQIVCLGEIFSTAVFSLLLEGEGFAHRWVDARDLIRTDDAHRDARVDEAATAAAIREKAGAVIAAGQALLTQGFIGATADNASVTLGREGSDYTAALLGAALRAESVSIWKDVDALLSADPRHFPQTAVPIPRISFREAIEMAYYGAQVIHPKTIKPLYNSGIPLRVRSFLHPEAPGTWIEAGEECDAALPPLVILKEGQVLIEVTAPDYSFMAEEALASIYAAASGARLKLNLMQHAAISAVACADWGEAAQRFMTALESRYRVRRNEGVRLLTVRHPGPDGAAPWSGGAEVLLEQRTRGTVQVVLR